MSKKELLVHSLDEIKSPFYPCPICDQETVIQISRDSDRAHIYTNDLTMLTKLKRAARAKDSQWRLIAIDYMRGLQCGWGFDCPKRLISYRSKALTKASEESPDDEEI